MIGKIGFDKELLVIPDRYFRSSLDLEKLKRLLDAIYVENHGNHKGKVKSNANSKL